MLIKVFHIWSFQSDWQLRAYIHIYIYTEYITRCMARRYEFYFRVLKTIFLPQENKIHIFKPPGNFLFIIWTRVFCTNNSVRAGNDVIGILTSKNMENLYVTRVLDVFYEWSIFH